MSHDPSWASSPRARSVMQGNRSRDTLPELTVRRAVHARGLRYFVGRRPLPHLRRTADMVFPRAKVAVFVDGCYWHGCPVHYTPSQTHREYWSSKLSRNQERDRETDALLQANGWLVVRIWEHEDCELAADRISAILRGDGGDADTLLPEQ